MDNLDGQGWTRADIPSLTRELAAETRALRMLHLPDTRTAAQKRKVMEARAVAGGGSSSGNSSISGGGGVAGAAIGGTLAASHSNGFQEAVNTVVEVADAQQQRKREFAEGGPGSLSPR